MPIFLIFFAFICFAIVMGIFSHMQAKQRREMLATWATQYELDFNPDDDDDFEDRYLFELFNSGSDRYAYNVCSGDWNGRWVITFDYHYETYSRDSDGKRTTTHHNFSGVLMNTPMRLEPLDLRLEGFFDGISRVFGFDDIDFESVEFSDHFHVTADDKRWAYDVITPRMMEFLLEHCQHDVSLYDHWILITQKEKVFDIPEFEQAIRLAEGFLDRVPNYLRKDLVAVGQD